MKEINEAAINEVGGLLEALDYLEAKKRVESRVPAVAPEDKLDAIFVEYKQIERGRLAKISNPQ